MNVKFKKGVKAKLPASIDNGTIYAINDTKELIVDVNNTRIDLQEHDSSKQDALVSGTNIKTINSQSILGSGDISVGGDNIFVATYEETTLAEVQSAYEDGKYIYCVVDDLQYRLSSAGTNDFTFQTSMSAGGMIGESYLFLDINGWSNDAFYTYDYESTDELLNAKQNTLVSGTNIKTVNNNSLLGSGNIQIDGGVQSVNGQTGVVVLDAEDVGALPSSTSIPTKTSDLTNDSGFITNSYHDSTKQDVISDLSTIRSGASLGATSIQPNDNVSELTNDAGYLTSHQSLSNYYNKTETDTLLSAKQDNLPSVVNDRYLHTNSSTGALEWSVVQGSVVALTTQEVDTIWENN